MLTFDFDSASSSAKSTKLMGLKPTSSRIFTSKFLRHAFIVSLLFEKATKRLEVKSLFRFQTLVNIPSNGLPIMCWEVSSTTRREILSSMVSLARVFEISTSHSAIFLEISEENWALLSFKLAHVYTGITFLIFSVLDKTSRLLQVSPSAPQSTAAVMAPSSSKCKLSSSVPCTKSMLLPTVVVVSAGTSSSQLRLLTMRGPIFFRSFSWVGVLRIPPVTMRKDEVASSVPPKLSTN
mmetsp:Transcript_16794/g.36658  ORF Transcript_16794/g.36658 Transcript_16794/m.36658 type:complete len:237 (+) Transcript_16794:858-1568(+)